MDCRIPTKPGFSQLSDGRYSAAPGEGAETRPSQYLCNEIRRFSICRHFRSERSHLSHSERLLLFGSPMHERGASSWPTASAPPCASHILRNFLACGEQTAHGPDLP